MNVRLGVVTKPVTVEFADGTVRQLGADLPVLLPSATLGDDQLVGTTRDDTLDGGANADRLIGAARTTTARSRRR